MFTRGGSCWKMCIFNFICNLFEEDSLFFTGLVASSLAVLHWLYGQQKMDFLKNLFFLRGKVTNVVDLEGEIYGWRDASYEIPR